MIVRAEDDMRDYGRQFASQLRPGDCVAIDGPLGAGKTVLCSGILAGLGFAGEVASPSYAIAHHYNPPEVEVAVTHADLYRLGGPTELDELGLDEERSERIMLVEWAGRVGNGRLRASHHIIIAPCGDGSRILELRSGYNDFAS
jgi:tRNA threonylcarbamoyladenosine biosynthesis protein TsaE